MMRWIRCIRLYTARQEVSRKAPCAKRSNDRMGFFMIASKPFSAAAFYPRTTTLDPSCQHQTCRSRMRGSTPKLRRSNACISWPIGFHPRSLALKKISNLLTRRVRLLLERCPLDRLCIDEHIEPATSERNRNQVAMVRRRQSVSGPSRCVVPRRHSI